MADDDSAAFWAYSLQVYAHPGVAEMCLRLQDEFSFDVNLLLLCCWTAEQHRASFDRDAMKLLQTCIAPINHNAVSKLRATRRWLKSTTDPDTSSAVSLALYQAVKRTELAAERVVQETLIKALDTRMFTPATTKELAANASMAAYSALLGIGVGEEAGLLPKLTRLILSRPIAQS